MIRAVPSKGTKCGAENPAHIITGWEDSPEILSPVPAVVPRAGALVKVEPGCQGTVWGSLRAVGQSVDGPLGQNWGLGLACSKHPGLWAAGAWHAVSTQACGQLGP